MDDRLSSRAGLNIGIEPTLLPFVQASAGDVIPVPRSGDTVLGESTNQAARVIFLDETIVGFVWNSDSAPSTQVDVLFRDELGNEILLAEADVSVPGPGPGPVQIFTENGEEFSFACLAPGEQIIARIVAPPPSGPS